MKTITFFAGSLAPIVLAGVSGVAMAQATLNETATGGVERIVVTAQKREEFLEDVPSSIKVFTADEIDNLQIDTLTDIALLSPSVAINEGLSPIFTDITVRGIAGLGGSQRTFGIYIDGFEISANSTAGAAVRFDDIERIEVLRGPQGTTFGRNVIAGAFNITTRDIGDELGGYSEVKVENFGGYGLRGGVDIPIKPGMGVRASAFYDHSDGYIENIGSAGGKNDSDTYGGRLKFVGDLTDRLSVNATLTYDKHEQGLANFIPDGDLDTGLDLLVDLVDAGVNPFFAPGSIPAGPSELFPRQNDTVELNSPTGFDTENILAILRFDYAFDNMDLVWVSGYLDSEVNREEDNDLSELDAVALVQNDTADFVSTEIRLQSSGDAALSWTVGAYAAKADNLITNALFSGTEVDQFYRLPGGVPLDLIPPFPPVTLPGDVSIFPNNLQLFGDNLETEETAFALFAEVEYDITDTVSVFAGARYNRDEIEQRSSGSIELVTLSALADPDITETVPLTPEIAALQGTLAGLITLWPARLPSERVEDSFEKTTWRIGAKWEPVPDINLYGVVSTGYRPGGLQLTGGLTPPSFGPENLTNYEIGMKSFLFDGKASLNIALFHMDWEEIQIGTRAPGATFGFTDNIGEAEVRGVEIDFIARPVEGLTVGGGMAYLDTEILEFLDSSSNVITDPQSGQSVELGGFDRAGFPLPRTAEYSGNAFAEYTRPLTGALDAFGRIMWVYNGEQPDTFIVGGQDGRPLKKWERVDLRFGVEAPDDWRFEVYGENIFDEIYATGKTGNGFSIAGQYVVSPPRQIGARFTKQF